MKQPQESQDIIIQQKGYQNESILFDVWAQHEDPDQKLKKYLLESFDWRDKTVLELGAGNGRITDYYVNSASRVILTDASGCMVSNLKKKYADYHSVTIHKCRHEDLWHLPIPSADVFLSAFSLGYTFATYDYTPKMIREQLSRIIPSACRQIIIIECTGIFDPYDNTTPGFKKYINELSLMFSCERIETRFRFDTWEEAAQCANLFFPRSIAIRIAQERLAEFQDIISVWHNT